MISRALEGKSGFTVISYLRGRAPLCTVTCYFHFHFAPSTSFLFKILHYEEYFFLIFKKFKSCLKMIFFKVISLFLFLKTKNIQISI